jgi:hypothetical protein
MRVPASNAKAKKCDMCVQRKLVDSTLSDDRFAREEYGGVCVGRCQYYNFSFVCATRTPSSSRCASNNTRARQAYLSPSGRSVEFLQHALRSPRAIFPPLHANYNKTDYKDNSLLSLVHGGHDQANRYIGAANRVYAVMLFS